MDTMRPTAVCHPVFHGMVDSQVEIAWIASSPSGLWMNHVGRNLTGAVDGLRNGQRYLIPDRDPLFTAELLEPAG